MAFYFESGRDQTVQLPQKIVDGYLSVATGEQWKVLLCLLRFEGMPLTNEMIAKQCHLAEDGVQSALRFWTEQNVLKNRGSTLCMHTPETVQQIKLPTYSSDEILTLKEQNTEFAQVLEAAQGILGKIFNHNDASILYGIYDNLGFRGELILQLLGFCAAKGKSGFRYIEKVALDWHDRGIDTFEKADNYIRHLEKLERDEHRIAVMFGIEGRALSKKEKEYIGKWREEMGLGMELIGRAYDVCVDTKSKLSFAYINGILSDWHSKGYKLPEDIQSAPAVTSELSEFEREAFASLRGE